MSSTKPLQINSDRLHEAIHSTCDAFGSAMRYGPGPTDTGMARLSLDDADAGVRAWFATTVAQAGCTVTVDQMGNMFAIRPGKKAGAPTAVGSHLDTQPTGGRYDGILGVQAGVEIMRTLHENNIVTEYPVCVINWTNEEGARFPKSVISSSVWAGVIPIEEAWALADVKDPSATMRSELERIGFFGDVACSHTVMPLAAHFELHIEQGPILEATGKRVGVVLGGQAYRWYTLRVNGRDSHTGTTPYSTRSDSLLCAAKIIVASSEIAKKFGGLCTTGILTLLPGSTNVIPSLVSLTLDIRHSSNEVLTAIDAAIQAEGERIAKEESERGCTLEWIMDSDAPAATFHADTIAAVKAAATSAVGDSWVEIWSGAGHDSCAVSTRCPTSMVFIPSKDGISHNPVEYSTPAQCADGVQVIFEAVLGYDAKRTK
ncbi:hypothetical protein RQP46_004912 [Phenoliferia psychrophenolica]